jgi:hypothetical protein
MRRISKTALLSQVGKETPMPYCYFGVGQVMVALLPAVSSVREATQNTTTFFLIQN